MSIVQQVLALFWRLFLRLTWRFRQKFYGQQLDEDELNQSIRRYHHMDEDLPEDVEDILELSALLEIREYDYFGLAYLWWFGQLPNSRVLESHFVRYMFNKIVPHWVRGYSRMILDLQSQGVLNKEELGISRLPDATPQSVRAGLRYFVMILITMGLLVLIAEVAVQFRVVKCLLPPCY